MFKSTLERGTAGLLLPADLLLMGIKGKVLHGTACVIVERLFRYSQGIYLIVLIEVKSEAVGVSMMITPGDSDPKEKLVLGNCIETTNTMLRIGA